MGNKTFMKNQNKRLIAIISVIVFILLLPLAAMQFTDEVNWTAFDFFAAAVLLFGTGLLCELALRKIREVKYRVAVCGILLTALLVIWAELAVGIFS